MSDEIPQIAQIQREADEDDDGAVENAHGDLDLEAPEADSAEQRTDLLQHRDEPVTSRPPADRDGEANPADTAEQRRVVAVDEDEDETRR
ncbi:hypothetical protein [Streptomyces sp. NPDC021224]|uniref:hypothetical protein n=1 Tax=unclassified Streptomyces TaxID=2593676 RepID=UPI003797F373